MLKFIGAWVHFRGAINFFWRRSNSYFCFSVHLDVTSDLEQVFEQSSSVSVEANNKIFQLNEFFSIVLQFELKKMELEKEGGLNLLLCSLPKGF